MLKSHSCELSVTGREHLTKSLWLAETDENSAELEEDKMDVVAPLVVDYETPETD